MSTKKNVEFVMAYDHGFFAMLSKMANIILVLGILGSLGAAIGYYNMQEVIASLSYSRQDPGFLVPALLFVGMALASIVVHMVVKGLAHIGTQLLYVQQCNVAAYNGIQNAINGVEK